VLPPRNALTICFAHAAYGLQEQFLTRQTGIASFELRTLEDLERRIGEADALVVSGLWRNELLTRAKRLRFIQSISAGVDQYSLPLLRERGIRLASAQGANERAVAEHAMAMILALTRRLPEARDNQARRHWRGMIADSSRREDELAGKTLLIIGLGRIGGRLARLAKAFDLHVVGVRRDPVAGRNGADEVHGTEHLGELLPQADILALTCPLTPQTEGLIDARALGLMRRTAILINVARGRCVDEAALVAALGDGRLAAAGLDSFVEEPLPQSTPLWGFENVLITPHTAGETRRYEKAIIDLVMENLAHLWAGESVKNGIV
jgi:phosphoglycerate dehydrogenase-like enzyme